jgi:hypothetical protein
MITRPNGLAGKQIPHSPFATRPNGLAGREGGVGGFINRTCLLCTVTSFPISRMKKTVLLNHNSF